MPWSPLPTPDGPDGPAPDRLGGLLDAVMAGLGGPRAGVLVTVHERWSDLVGAEVAGHAHLMGLEDGVLRIGVDGPAWASHLRWAEADIIERSDRLVGAAVITSIQVRVERPRT